MRLAMIGLGRMGMRMAERLLQGGHEVVAYNRTPEKTDRIARKGAIPAADLEEVVERLSPPRTLWLMLPAGDVVDAHLEALRPRLSRGDILIDGGNSFYKDDIRRAGLLDAGGIHFLDAGVSGGVWGLTSGYCLMIGGPRQIYQYMAPVFTTLAPEKGVLYCGPSGAGHFVKMVHNGIEYGMMQAYAEGFHLLESSPYSENLDLAEVSRVWNRGSVIRSWLLELAEGIFQRDGRLERIQGYVEDSGEGRWTLEQAAETGTPTPVMAQSLMSRFRSRQQDVFSDRVVAALRQEFGGHPVRKLEEK